jgi:hypothetical protein
MTLAEYESGYTDPDLESFRQRRAEDEAWIAAHAKRETPALVAARKAVKDAETELEKCEKLFRHSGLSHNSKFWCGLGSIAANAKFKQLSQNLKIAKAQLEQAETAQKTDEECAEEMDRCRRSGEMMEFLHPLKSLADEKEKTLRKLAYVIQYNSDGSHQHINRCNFVKCNCVDGRIDPDTEKLPNFMIVDRRSAESDGFDADSGSGLVDLGVGILQRWSDELERGVEHDFSGQMLGMTCIAVGEGLLPKGNLYKTCARILS